MLCCGSPTSHNRVSQDTRLGVCMRCRRVRVEPLTFPVALTFLIGRAARTAYLWRTNARNRI